MYCTVPCKLVYRSLESGHTYPRRSQHYLGILGFNQKYLKRLTCVSADKILSF